MESCARIPYFNATLEQLQQGNSEVIVALGQHFHYGYWAQPDAADGSAADFAHAAETLTRRMCTLGGASDGMRILDVGCGFGGTLASLDQHYTQVELVGLNLDTRQLLRAHQQMHVQPTNRLYFTGADAMRLPFPDNSFDLVLAVECIFHFPDRLGFLHEARRVLRPGGRLALSDFVSAPPVRFLLQYLDGVIARCVAPSFGPWDLKYSLHTYQTALRNAGFRLIVEEDITRNSLPSFPVWRRLARQSMQSYIGVDELFRLFEWAHRSGLLRYMILVLQTETPRFAQNGATYES